jgi:hypothetical protein
MATYRAISVTTNFPQTTGDKACMKKQDKLSTIQKLDTVLAGCERKKALISLELRSFRNFSSKFDRKLSEAVLLDDVISYIKRVKYGINHTINGDKI